MSASENPSPEQIAAECLLIQAGWSPEEKLRRMSPNMRPQVSGADGHLWDVAAADYHEPDELNAQYRLTRDGMHKAVTYD